jgi:hypothetical protein
VGVYTLANKKPVIKIKPTRFAFIILLACISYSALPLTSSGIVKPIDMPPCPSLSMICPTYVVSGRSPITFSLDVSGAPKKGLKDNEVVLIFKNIETKLQLSYKWEVSGGKIIKGQDTRTIVVEPNNAQSGNITNVVATVETKGGPPECERSRSCSLEIGPDCNAPEKFGSYGDIKFEDEKEKLDNFAIYLLGRGPDSVAYILGYGGRDSCWWEEGKLRAERARNYLMEKYRIDDDRIIAFDGGYRESLSVDLYFSPRKGCGPFPIPTLRMREVTLGGLCFEKYSGRKVSLEPKARPQ